MSKKKIFPALIPILIFATVIRAKDEIGGLFAGVDILPNNEYNETRSGIYQLQRVGAAFGLIIPFNLPLLDCHYRIKLSVHGIKEKAWGWQGQYQGPEEDLYDRHLSAANEILVGKEFKSGNRIGLLPQLGLGVLLDGLYQDNDSRVGGVVYHCLFTDFSVTLRYHLRNFGMGITSNYQASVRASWEGYTATDRVAFSCCIFK
jgi:hypothetical protein